MAKGLTDSKKRQKGRKIGRNKRKCERYRARVGKPLGKGVEGNKSGMNKVRHGDQDLRKLSGGSASH